MTTKVLKIIKKKKKLSRRILRFQEIKKKYIYFENLRNLIHNGDIIGQKNIRDVF